LGAQRAFLSTKHIREKDFKVRIEKKKGQNMMSGILGDEFQGETHILTAMAPRVLIHYTTLLNHRTLEPNKITA
jgi:hypothetical protein